MRKIFNYFFLLSLAGLFSCKKQGDVFNIEAGNFQNNALTVSVNTLVLTQANENDTAMRFTWAAASFGNKPVITYTLQLAVAADTAANGWSHAKNYTISPNTKSYALQNKDVNNLLNTLSLPPGVASKMVARIRAEVNQSNGAASSIPTIYTNVTVMDITPFALALYVPGDYQGWNPGAAPQLAPVPDRPGLYEGYVNMPGAGLHYFKYTNAPDWNHTNFGDGGNGTFNIDGAAAGLSVPDGGYYYLTANMNTNSWTATRVIWGILGDASPGGWNTDTHLDYDAVNQVWKVTANMIKNGSFKFRANNDWKLDFGIDNTGALRYADNPFLGYTPDLNNLSVADDGNYTITLDLHIPGKYTHILHKN